MGDRGVRKLYSDNSGEIGKALKELKIMPHNSQPGVPQTNAVIERLNQDILDGTRTSLVRAGLPACFWPFAAERYCLQENVHTGVDGGSPWCKTHVSCLTDICCLLAAKSYSNPLQPRILS